MSNRTWDGKPLTAAISGFSEYRTEGETYPQKPTPIFSPEEVMQELQKLQGLMRVSEIRGALQLLADHIKDPNNPHHTELSQFVEQIGDALYSEFIKRGGQGNRDTYLQALFNTLRVANLEEMKTSTDPRLLISILGARRFIEEHENDQEAHLKIFQSILPGQPIQVAPEYSLMAEFGLAKDKIVADPSNQVPYSYIGKDLKLHYCEEYDDLPIDWSYGLPLIPLFGPRTNLISNSTDFMGHPWWFSNVTVLPEANIAPDGTTTATAVFTVSDIIPVQHILMHKDLTIQFGKTKIFSIFAKPESCRYFQISYKDMLSSRIVVRAIFDLHAQTCILINPLNRYKAEIQKLNNGWSRCIFSMSHEIGQQSDLELSFFHEKDPSQQDLRFVGDEELMGYVWGAQLEEGTEVSPYIPTSGTPVTRSPLYLKIPLSKELKEHKSLTLDINYKNPKEDINPADKPILSMQSKDGTILMAIRHRNTNYTEIMHYTKLQVGDISAVTATFSEMLPPFPDDFNQLVHGFNGTSCISALNTIFRDNTRINQDIGDYILVGTDGKDYFDGYLDSLTIYPTLVTKSQTEFLNGDLYE